MEKVILVGVGGLVGAIGRYTLSGTIHRLLPLAQFPYGTLTVNVLGCLLIGFLAGVGEARALLGPDLRLLLLVGLLGGFTTFSTFAYETLAMARDGQSLRALANVLLQVTVCLLAVWMGDYLARALSAAV